MSQLYLFGEPPRRATVLLSGEHVRRYVRLTRQCDASELPLREILRAIREMRVGGVDHSIEGEKR